MVTYTEIFGDNPWWRSEEEINEDAKIKEWETSNIQWNPRIRYTFDYSNDIIYSLRGPRQVGKTTLIKIQIREFLQKGILPWSIMYYAFDIDNTPKDLVKVIENYLDRSKRQRGNNRAYLFLDEVSSIKDWQKCLLSACPLSGKEALIIFHQKLLNHRVTSGNLQPFMGDVSLSRIVGRFSSLPITSNSPITPDISNLF